MKILQTLRRYGAPVLFSLLCASYIAQAQIVNPGSPATGVPLPGTGISVAGQTVSINYGVANSPFTGNMTVGGTLGVTGASTLGATSATTLSASSTVSGAGFTSFMASPPPVGSTAANSGAFTTLLNSGTFTSTGAAVLNGAVSGTGLATYEANLNHAQSVLNVAALRALNCVSGLVYATQGYSTIADGGQAQYVCNGADTTTPDNGGNFIAAANTFRYYLQPYAKTVRAEQFGAVGNGSTNNLTAINNALAAYPTGVLEFGPGTFVVNGVVVKPVGATIRGQGMGITTITLANASNPVAVIQTNGFAGLTGGSSTGGEFNSEISHLTIDGNKANNTTSGACIQLYGKNFRLYDFRVQNCAGVSLYTEYGGADNFSTPAGTLETYIAKGFLQNGGGSGFVMRGPHDMFVDTLQVFSNTGWGIDNTFSITVHGVNTYLNSSGGGWTHGSGSIAGSALVGSTATGTGWYFQSGGNNVSASSFGGPIALQIDANNNYIGGVVANSTTSGLKLGTTSAQLTGNLVLFNNTGTIFDVSATSGGLRSMVQAFVGDATGTLQNGAFQGTWQITGYTGFAGSGNQLYGGAIFSGGGVYMPTTNFGTGTTRTFSDTSPPGSGSFIRGDYVKNSLPAVGSPKGWYCTVTGSPGTWVSEGNL